MRVSEDIWAHTFGFCLKDMSILNRQFIVIYLATLFDKDLVFGLINSNSQIRYENSVL